MSYKLQQEELKWDENVFNDMFQGTILITGGCGGLGFAFCSTSGSKKALLKFNPNRSFYFDS